MTELIVAVPLVTLKLRYIIDDEDMLIELLASRRYLYPAFKVSDVITNSSLATDVTELKALSYILAEFAFTELKPERKKQIVTRKSDHFRDLTKMVFF